MELSDAGAIRTPPDEPSDMGHIADVTEREFPNARAATIFGGASEIRLELIAAAC